MTLSPKLGVVGISTLWHFRLPLPIQMFIKVASSPRLSGIGMPSPILWSHPLKMQRIVLLSSLLWWELGTNSLITGPGEWLSFRRFTSNYPDPDPDTQTHTHTHDNIYMSNNLSTDIHLSCQNSQLRLSKIQLGLKQLVLSTLLRPWTIITYFIHTIHTCVGILPIHYVLHWFVYLFIN